MNPGFEIDNRSSNFQDDDQIRINQVREKGFLKRFILRNNLTKCLAAVAVIFLIIWLLKIANNKRKEIGHQFYQEHRNDDKRLTFPYPTAGMREPGVPFDFTEIKYGQEYYNFQKYLNQLLKPYNDTNCDIVRMGPQDSDGGYAYCSNFMKDTKALINIGVGYEGNDVLGCDFVKKHFIPNFQFDCSTDKKPKCEPYDYMNIFKSTCIGQIPQSSYYQYDSFKSIIDQNGLVGKKIIIKSDVQGAEWVGFRTFPLQYLDNVDQLLIEVHLPGVNQFHKVYKGDLDIIKSLSERFVSVNMHMTNSVACEPLERLQKKERFFTSFAIETTLINKRLITINSPTRSYAIALNKKINVKSSWDKSEPDCQMSD